MSEPRELSQGAIVRRLISLTLRYRGDLLAVLSLQFVLLAMGLFGLSLTGLGIDYLRHSLGGATGAPLATGLGASFIPRDAEPLHVLGGIALIVLALALVRAWLNFTYTVALNRLVQQKLVVDLRSQIYERLQRLSFRFFDANSTGSIIARTTADVQSLRMFVDQVLMQGVIMVVSLGVYLTYMLRLHPGLTLACLATTPALCAMTLVFSRRIQPRYTENRELSEQMIQGFTEAVQGVQVTKAFGQEQAENRRFADRNRRVLDQQFGIFWRVSLFSPAVGLLTRVNLLVLLGYGGWLVVRGDLALGSGLVVFVGLLEQFSGQVNQVATVVNSAQQSLVGARRVFSILDAPVEIANRPGALRCGRLRGEVEFDNVSFAYSGDDAVVREVSLRIPPGCCVAILGATGAGKSALMSLIPRFFDVASGAVRVDGVDVRDYHLDDLRRNIGLVFQESFLFSNTIAMNIAFGHPEATREQVERAARIAAADEFIRALPKGYDTVLGEGGLTLSGGQRQRLALARALLLEPSILLLDDPTAAVDAGTEHEIFGALEGAMQGRTTFIVAHRVSTLRRADLIIVMERGRIVQQGTHAALMAMPGPYLRVAQLQLVDASDLATGEGARA
ncbi:ABC transporter ATP-binding protein [Nibricoccus sp. IMCC34717]|uniref:ABC transporter ATP-binding protein n=1 Tax=Nibricoccus sp. IMCC34717 TaxID=3034021 RepID=UPI00384E6D5D